MRRSKTSRRPGQRGDLFTAAADDAADDAAKSPAADEDLSPEVLAERVKKRAQEAEVAAVRLLSRRDHSTEELRRKLASKGHPAASVAAVMEKLGAKKLVSDERFVAGFVHQHARRGQGPVRIRAELRQQGIADPQIKQEVGAADVDWKQRAVEVRRRKFGAELPSTQGERAKQARFLQYRGFNSDQIRAALSFDPEMDGEPDA